jgi:hypothetical protein
MVTPGLSPTRNNSAVVTGAYLGVTAVDLPAQRKKLEVKVDGLAAELTVGDAYLYRLTPVTENAYLVVGIKNTSQTDLCFIKAGRYRWLAADGTALFMAGADEAQYVNGGVRAISALSYSDSCLGPGESGTLTDVKVIPEGGMLYSRVAAVGLDLTGPFAAAASPPAGKLVPTGYDVGTCNGQRSVKVVLSNTGSAAVALEKFNFCPAILLDDEGLPTGWMFLQPPAKVAIPAGGTTVIYASLFMEPRVRRLQIYVDFGPP